MDTFRTPVPLNVEDSIVDKYFFRAGGSHVSRIQAKVADEYESGTDCIVHLELHNPRLICPLCQFSTVSGKEINNHTKEEHGNPAT